MEPITKQLEHEKIRQIRGLGPLVAEYSPSTESDLQYLRPTLSNIARIPLYGEVKKKVKRQQRHLLPFKLVFTFQKPQVRARRSAPSTAAHTSSGSRPDLTGTPALLGGVAAANFLGFDGAPRRTRMRRRDNV